MKKILNYSLFLLILLSFSCSNDDQVLQESQPLHVSITSKLKKTLNLAELPVAMVSNTNETSKEAVVAFNDIVEITNQIVAFLEVPNTTISSNITNSKESFSWIDILFEDTVEVNYEIEKQLDKYSFTYNISKGSFSLNFLKGNTSLDENSGIFIINEGSSTGSLTWEITEKSLIIELLFQGKTTLIYNKIDKSGTLSIEDIIYKWNENGSGSSTNNSSIPPIIKTW
ncbi:hypothetical protein ACSIGC_11485 [Tenacibaculum sp. ZS6-P6]|uniref:hypothetical protein n=1 Tax=Tenacibaculum sp. ZS6-P6 TaxID=3447503 RepID=UPI003F9B43CC